MKTPIISSSAAAQSSVPSLIFRAYTVKELACLYFPQKTATGASRSLRALIRHDPELLSQLRAKAIARGCTTCHPLPCRYYSSI